jgi:hypothetical protein
MLLAGCVEVEMQVSSLGKITQTFTATVSQRAADVLKAAAQNYLGRNWRISVERKGEMNIVQVWRTYSSRPETKPMPGMTVEFRRRNGWFRATYELRVHYEPAELFQTKDEEVVAANRKVTVRIYTERSNVASVEGNTAELNLDPLSRTEVRVVAVGFIWWRIGLLFLVLAALVWLIAPYIPRIVERMRRPTVKVVQR